MSASSKNDKQHLQGGDCESSVATPPSGGGGSGHKASFRSANKLARRARSFKEDLLERISAMAMRSPGQQPSNRSHSPLSPKTRGQPKVDDIEVNPAKDLEVLVRQVRFDLRHFCDVISKKKLEMLPGNGTIILDTITNIHTVIRPYVSPLGVSPSAALSSALGRLCQALARLIRLCDEGMMGGEGCAALHNANVEQITQEVHNAVEELANIAFEKLGVNTSQIKTNGTSSDPKYLKLQVRPAITNTPDGQRNSLPDIPLTSQERLILEGSAGGLSVVRSSHSTESILDSVSNTPHHVEPPPKPPRPVRSLEVAPPLPPKKKINENTSLLGLSGIDRVSLASHSSGSLDSMLNTSNDEEIRAIMDRSSTHLDDDIMGTFNCASSDGFSHNTNGSNRLSVESSTTVGSSPANSNITPTCNMSSNVCTIHQQQQQRFSGGDVSISGQCQGSPSHNRNSYETTLHTNPNRFSNESGFVSMGTRCSEISYSSFNSVTTQQQKTSLSFIDATPTPQDVPPSITDFMMGDEKTICNVQSPPPKTLGISMSNVVQQSMKQVSSANYFEQNSQSKKCFSQSSVVKEAEQQIESLKIESSSSVTKHNVMQTVVSSNVKSNSSNVTSINGIVDDASDNSLIPPALPAKTRKPKVQCDSFNDSTLSSLNTTMDDQAIEYRNHSACTLHAPDNFIQRPHTLMDHSSSSNQPPPLPLKKKHIMAYMEMFGNCSHPPQNNMEFLRHSVHTYNSVQHPSGHFVHASQLQQLASSAHMSSGHENLSIASFQQNGQTMLSVGQNGHAFASSLKGQTSTSISNQNEQAIAGIMQNGQIVTGCSTGFSHLSQSQTVHQFNIASSVSSHPISSSSPQRSPRLILEEDKAHLPPLPPPHSPTSPSVSPRESQSNVPPALPPKKGKSFKSQSLISKTSSISGVSYPNTPSSMCYIPTPTSGSARGANVSPQPKSQFDIQPPQPTLDVVDDALLLNVEDENWHKQQEQSIPNKPGKFPVGELDLEDNDMSHAAAKSNIPPPPPQMANTPSPVPRATDMQENDGEVDLIIEMDVSNYLVKKRPDEEGPDIRGGHPDALVVHAIKSTKDFSYQEAFLTTYRTFVPPLMLIEKLNRRHKFLSRHGKHTKAREVQALLTRVVGDLTIADLDDRMVQLIMDFVYGLVSSGDLAMAKVLRVIILDKYKNKINAQQQQSDPFLNAMSVRRDSVLEHKSEAVAEQMTLLDAELFARIPAPEALLWARDQCEETSPNLTRFTEHFNKMSYWARSKILEQEDAKDREKYVTKFIKVMKHLRKMNNFNSYLALLSALDSAPIRRLEWQKHITDALKEYCTLIDSSSSFRAYRQALAETQPPCIPYIGLVLQDLTFVHIGNTDLLSCGSINFSKRWQQYHILENMKRFSKPQYPFKKNERIIAMFNGFNDCINEEAMWQISESIKPRGGKKTAAA